MKRGLKTVIGIAIIVAIFAYLIRGIVVNWQQVKDFHWQIGYLSLFMSFLFFAASQLFSVWVWLQLLKKFGYELSFGKLFVIWWISAMGRYLPGKVWQLAGLAIMGEREGIPAEVTTSASILTQVLAILAGFVISIPIVMAQKKESIYFLLITVVFLILMVYPPVFKRWINFIGKKIRGIEIRVHLNTLSLLEFILLYGFLWIGYGVGFGLFVRGITGANFTLDYIPIYAFSYIVGLITVFVPGGFGVREGLMTAFLKDRFGEAVASAVAIVARIWVTIVELFFFLIAISMMARRKDGA